MFMTKQCCFKTNIDDEKTGGEGDEEERYIVLEAAEMSEASAAICIFQYTARQETH